MDLPPTPDLVRISVPDNARMFTTYTDRIGQVTGWSWQIRTGLRWRVQWFVMLSSDLNSVYGPMENEADVDKLLRE